MVNLSLIQQYTHITDEKTCSSLANAAELVSFAPGAVIVPMNSIQDSLYLHHKGVVRSFYLNPNGKEITDLFVFHPGYPTVVPSPDKPAIEEVVAMTAVELIRIPLRWLTEQSRRDSSYLPLYIHLYERGLIMHCRVKMALRSYSATQRYIWFTQEFAPALSCASGKQIASFLGVSPETLSRIRNSAQVTPQIEPTAQNASGESMKDIQELFW